MWKKDRIFFTWKTKLAVDNENPELQHRQCFSLALVSYIGEIPKKINPKNPRKLSDSDAIKPVIPGFWHFCTSKLTRKAED